MPLDSPHQALSSRVSRFVIQRVYTSKSARYRHLRREDTTGLGQGTRNPASRRQIVHKGSQLHPASRETHNDTRWLGCAPPRDGTVSRRAARFAKVFLGSNVLLLADGLKPSGGVLPCQQSHRCRLITWRAFEAARLRDAPPRSARCARLA